MLGPSPYWKEYKILAEVLARPLKKVLLKVVSEE